MSATFGSALVHCNFFKFFFFTLITPFVLVFLRLKTCLISCKAVFSFFFKVGYSNRFAFGQVDFFALLCTEGIVSLFLHRPVLFPVLPLHLLVASWSDKPRQVKGCGSLNQPSLHAFNAKLSLFSPKAEETTSAAHLSGENESQTTSGLLPEAILWPLPVA